MAPRKKSNVEQELAQKPASVSRRSKQNKNELKVNETKDTEIKKLKKRNSYASKKSDSEKILSNDSKSTTKSVHEVSQKPSTTSKKRKPHKSDSNESSGTKEIPKKKRISQISVEKKPDESVEESILSNNPPLKGISDKKKKLKTKVMEAPGLSVDEMNIEQLLALGESSQLIDMSNCELDEEEEFAISSESSMSDLEEVTSNAITEPVIPKEGVDITLEAPMLHKKNRKKGIDLEAHVRRQMNRVRKDLQLLMHKVHVLCWIAHLRFVNNTLNNPSIMKTCTALVKSKNLYPSKYADLSYLEGILKWYHKNIEFKKDVTDPLCTGGLFKELKYQLEKKQAFNYKYFIFMFIILLRVLGLKTRVVMSFQVLPVKPTLLELYGDVIKERSEKLKKAKEASTCSNVDQDKSDIKDSKGPIGKKSPGKVSASQKKTSKKRTTKDNNKVEDTDDDEELESSFFKSSSSTSKVVKSKLKSMKSKKNADKKNVDISDEDDDDDFTLASLTKSSNKTSEKKSNSKTEESQKKKEGFDIWTEVYLEAEEKWISVDVVKQKIHCIAEIYVRATHPVSYIIACNNDHTMKDVTKRYVPHWHSDTRKRRVDEEWWDETMKPYLPAKTAQDREEDEDISRQLHDQPMPSSISEFKDHPLYALKRHLLKFEAIYPPDAPTLGFVRGEPVYARECVHTLHSREMWYKQARVVRLKEEPYKIVKARPKYDRMTGEVKKDLPLELFGKWQTEDFIPPIATGGKVPRNEYGNVDLFKPCMLPIGTVHLQIPGLIRVAKKLDIDCAPATVGFEFHSGGSHPVFDGFVVCEEFKEALLDAWNKDIDELSKREAERKEKRVYGNWKRLIRGLLIREKLKIKYAFGENSDEEREPSTAGTSASSN